MAFAFSMGGLAERSMSGSRWLESVAVMPQLTAGAGGRRAPAVCPLGLVVAALPQVHCVQPSHAYRRPASRVVPGFSLSRTGWTLQRRERFRVHVQQPGALGVVPDTSRVAPGQDGAHELDLDDPPQCD